MFDDKIGDVFRDGRKIGEPWRRNRGAGFCIGLLILVILIPGGIVFLIVQVSTQKAISNANQIEDGATAYATKNYVPSDSNALSYCAEKSCLSGAFVELDNLKKLAFTNVKVPHAGMYTA